MKLKLINIEKDKDSYLKIVFERHYLFKEPTTHTVLGSCTVWNYYPSFRRCSTPLERWLCDKWKKWEYENAN